VTGAQVKIDELHNDALREHISIVNRGTLSSPMGGWVLATLRGKQFAASFAVSARLSADARRISIWIG